MSPSVGIVLPVYKPDIGKLNSYIDSIRELGIADVIHVELDSPSGASQRALAAPDSVNIAAERRGKGAAITAGFDTLSTDILAFADADGATPADSLQEVIRPVSEDAVEFTIGSRRHPEAIIQTHQTVLRRKMGDVFAWLARRTLPTSLYDYQCGAKALSADTWDELRAHIHEAGFAWDLELIAVAGALGYDIREVPITWDDAPDSTVNPITTALNMGSTLLEIRHRVKAIQGNPIHSTVYAAREQSTLNSNRSGGD